jgi:hypothetical protein
MIAVVRIAGETFDPDEYIARNGFAPDRIWRTDQPDAMGRVRTSSGFSLTIADATSESECLDQIREWLHRNKNGSPRTSGGGGRCCD